MKKILIAIVVLCCVLITMPLVNVEAAYGKKVLNNTAEISYGNPDPEGAVFNDKSAFFEENAGTDPRDPEVVYTIDTSGWPDDYKVTFNWSNGESVSVPVNVKQSIPVPEGVNGTENVQVVNASDSKESYNILVSNYIWLAKTDKVTISYQDEAGNKIADSNILSGTVGDQYKASPKAIEGYELLKSPGNEKGEFVDSSYDEEIEVIYIYSKVIPQYTILYDVNGGDTDDLTFTVETGSKTPLYEYADLNGNKITEPTRIGYKFMGWEPEVADIVTEDITYVAQWEEVDPTNPTDPTDSTRPTETVTIKPSQSETAKTDKQAVPKTGESMSMLPIMFIITAMLLILNVIVIKKREQSNN